jgi:prolyl-tRNA synthetase
LVLPPNLAPIQVVIVPIFKTDEEFEKISIVANNLIEDFKKRSISVKHDNRTTQKPGFKFAEWELKGVPVRIAIGPKDLENGTFEIARRDTLSKEVISKEGVVDYISDLLEQIQKDLFDKALNYRNNHCTEVNSFEEFIEILENKGGFIAAHWDGTAETEEKIKELTKATIRCIPLNRENIEGKCVLTGEKSQGRVLFAKAY